MIGLGRKTIFSITFILGIIFVLSWFFIISFLVNPVDFKIMSFAYFPDLLPSQLLTIFSVLNLLSSIGLSFLIIKYEKVLLTHQFSWSEDRE